MTTNFYSSTSFNCTILLHFVFILKLYNTLHTLALIAQNINIENILRMISHCTKQNVAVENGTQHDICS